MLLNDGSNSLNAVYAEEGISGDGVLDINADSEEGKEWHGGRDSGSDDADDDDDEVCGITQVEARESEGFGFSSLRSMKSSFSCCSFFGREEEVDEGGDSCDAFSGVAHMLHFLEFGGFSNVQIEQGQAGAAGVGGEEEEEEEEDEETPSSFIALSLFSLLSSSSSPWTFNLLV